MINVQTTDATNMSKEFSSMDQKGMGLGNNAPVRDLDAERQQYEDPRKNTDIGKLKEHWQKQEEEKQRKQEEQWEDDFYRSSQEAKQIREEMKAEKQTDAEQKEQNEEITQGQHETNLEEYYNTLDNLDNWNDRINNIDPKGISKKYINDIIKDLKQDKIIDDKWLTENNISGMSRIELKEKLTEEINKQKASTRDKINETKNNKSYDNRTDEQKREDDLHSNKEAREDNAYQRAVEDMRRSGLHPGLMFGGGGAAMSSGASAGSSSKDKEEEEKRRKKKRQQEEMEAMKQRELMRIMGSMASMLVLGSTRAIAPAMSAMTRTNNNNKKIDNANNFMNTWTRQSNSQWERKETARRKARNY